jgi:hypothetical protein
MALHKEPKKHEPAPLAVLAVYRQSNWRRGRRGMIFPVTPTASAIVAVFAR